MMRRQRCLDILRGDRCELRQGHPEPHRRGEHTWWVRDIPRPAWLERLRARDMTGVR